MIFSRVITAITFGLCFVAICIFIIFIAINAERVGFYAACKSMGLDMLYEYDEPYCGNITLINQDAYAVQEEAEDRRVEAFKRLIKRLNKT